MINSAISHTPQDNSLDMCCSDRKIGNARNVLADVKIARISTVPFFIVTLLKEQIEYLIDSGMDVTVVSSGGSELSLLNYGYHLKHKVINIQRSPSPWNDLRALVGLLILFIKEKYKIVHSTTPKAGLLTAIAAYFARVPVRIHTFTGQQWVNKKGAIRFFSRFADKVIGKLSIKCFADSKSQRQYLIDEKIVKEDKLEVIGEGSLSGVQIKRFDVCRWREEEKMKLRDDLSIGQSSKVILYVGRVAREKGIVELVTAFNYLLKDEYDTDLLMVGPLDSDCGGRASLSWESIAKNERVHYVGYSNTPESYMAIADILCLPSYREGFGTVVIEAASMGIPAVGTRINGLTDAIVDGETGILVQVRDSTALYEAIRTMLDDNKLIKKMGETARRRSIAYYDSNIINAKLMDEYSNLLKRAVGEDGAHE